MDHCSQMQQLDARKQLEAQTALHQRAREQLNSAQQELATLQSQLSSAENRLASPTTHTSLTG